jgi:hypothetical protein
MTELVLVRSGGQSGVDRAALDAAKRLGVQTAGWCPKGGWAEDYPTPPGLLKDYPELTETPTNNLKQRTEWNVRDADATLVHLPKDCDSPGTLFTIEMAIKYHKPCFQLIDLKKDFKALKRWCDDLSNSELQLNVAGPRASEYQGIYELTYRMLLQLFRWFKISQPLAQSV